MLIDKNAITSLIPQRFPFVMIDALVNATEQQFESRFEIDGTNLFLKENVLSESALIENIAQTCAAGFGYIGSQNGEEAGKLGFIGAISRLEVLGVAKLGDTIHTTVNVLSTFDTIHLVEGMACVGDQALLTCQMKIVVG